MDNTIIIKMAGKHINKNQEYYHIVFKTVIDDYLIYCDISLSRENNIKYNYYLNLDIVKSKSFGDIEEKIIIKASSFENKIIYVNNNNTSAKHKLNAEVEQKVSSIMNKCKNSYVKEFLNFSITNLKNQPEQLARVPYFITKFIEYRDKSDKEKFF